MWIDIECCCLHSFENVLLVVYDQKMYMQARFVRAEKNVKELSLSVDLMKKESRKLLERVALAEKDMLRGNNELMYKLFEVFLAFLLPVLY